MRTRDFILCALTALVAVTLCSRSSPLFPLNDWDDANIFFSLGKAWTQGIWPYRDIFEQKGPLLYAVHSVAALISWRTWTGVWLIEVLCGTLFLWYGIRTVRLLWPKAPRLIVPLAAAVVYASVDNTAGDSAEELALPMLACALYQCLRSERTAKGHILFGLTGALLLWTKYSLVGLHIGAALWMLWQERRLKPLWLWLQGALIPTARLLLVFHFDDALAHLLQVYIVDNITGYSTTTAGNPLLGKALNLRFGLRQVAWRTPLIGASIVAAAVSLWQRDRRTLCALGLPLAVCFALVFAPRQGMDYYPLALGSFVPVCLGAVLGAVRLGRWASLAAMALLFDFMLYANANADHRKHTLDDYPQALFAQEIAQAPGSVIYHKVEDIGVHFLLGTTPTHWHYTHHNIYKEKIADAQRRYMDAGEVDYVVSVDPRFVHPRYGLAAEAQYTDIFNDKKPIYLYRRTR